jgi:hypothetical protein
MIAISSTDAELYGCPYCGYRSGYEPTQVYVTEVIVCSECKGLFAVLAQGVTKSTCGFGELQPHPRGCTPKHGAFDTWPKTGGEYFRSKGIGFDGTAGCFVCSVRNARYSLTAFVKCKRAGERVVSMFRRGARLDYREYQPDWVQVRIGACEKHREYLKLLHRWTRKADDVITNEMLRQLLHATVTVQIAMTSIEEHSVYPSQEDTTVDLRIDFVPESVPVPNTTTCQDYAKFCSEVADALAVVASPGECRFFDYSVKKLFLTEEDAETALAEVVEMQRPE